jgi:hypothetical protein
MNKLDVWGYMVDKFGAEGAENIIKEYEENFGLNGLDYLWTLDSEKDVMDVIGDYI